MSTHSYSFPVNQDLALADAIGVGGGGSVVVTDQGLRARQEPKGRRGAALFAG